MVAYKCARFSSSGIVSYAVGQQAALLLAPAAEPAYHKDETQGMHLQELFSLASLGM